VTTTIDQDAVAETWAFPPGEEGYVERDGVRVHWELFGSGDRTVLLLPSWSIVPARVWKGQVAHLARRGRVVVFDPRGNGRSDRPADPSAYDVEEFVEDALAVLDATRTERAALVGLSLGAERQLALGARAPERVTHQIFIGPTLALTPLSAERDTSFTDELETYEGWDKYNEHHWRRDFRDFVEFFFRECLPEPHSTKQHDDLVGWGLQTDAETLIATAYAPGLEYEEVLALCAQVQCPVLVIHGTRDRISPHERGVKLAELTGGTLVTFEEGGHVVQGRDPVRVNLLISDFVHGPEPPARFVRAPVRSRPRAILVSSPIGLGHAQRDLAIARALRERRPDLEIDWLAQHPVTTVLEAAGERIHPASAYLAGESAHIEARSGDHRLPVFQAWRELDEILLANFMLFHDVVRAEHYDLWIGDEAWELDHFLHENPELKTSPFAFLTDFVGWVPMEEHGPREAFLTADYNAYTIELVERFPYVRDTALFVGEPDDVVPRTFGPDLPFIPDWVERHFDYTGYILPFDPAVYADTEPLRRELGLPADRPLVVAAVGGSAVGLPLLRTVAAAFAELRRDVPEAELLLVCGPRIDPAAIEPAEGMRVVGYVHDLFRTFACCDLAVVQGGLTTTMELVANRRPLISIPLRGHFEQNHHVAHRLRRYGAPEPTPYDGLTPATLAAQMGERLGTPVDYLPVASGGAGRAADLMLAATGL
jgi:pimeloyl-ACP methyl ester carboxylesterase/predicted glycosyltransferase